MPFEAVTNLASVQAAEDERKRRQQQAALQQDAADLKRQVADRAADDTSGPAALLAQIQKGGGKIAVDPDVIDQAGQDQFLNEQAQRRFTRRDAELGKRSEQLAVPGPSAAERATTMLGPLGSLATEDTSARDQELRTDPRGRLARLSQLKDSMLADPAGVSRETSPIYTDAPRARRGDTETMRYDGRVDALGGAEVPRSAIAPEFGGTGSAKALSFSDREQPGMRPYNSRSGLAKDVGAPGGGLSTVGGTGKDTTAQAALLAGLDEQIGQAKRQPFTPQERAADLAVQQPGWDTMASRTTPENIVNQVNTAVGEGRLNPATGQQLQRRYAALANEAYDSDGEFSAETWQNHLTSSRPPAPGEAEARLKTGGQQVAQTEVAKQQAVTSALQAPQDGPGATRSPALATGEADPRDALLREMQQPRGQSTTVPQVGGEVGYELHAPFIPPGMGQGPGVPPWMADLPENIRLALEGVNMAAGGHESQAERRRRLAREAARRG